MFFLKYSCTLILPQNNVFALHLLKINQMFKTHNTRILIILFTIILATRYITSNTPISPPVEPTTDASLPSTITTMGPKRGRLLIRQPRVKRDSDSTSATSSTVLSQHSPDIDIDSHPSSLHFTPRHVPPPRHTTDPFAGSISATSATNLTTSQHHSHHLHYPLHIYHQSAPSSSSSSHLLTVPESNPNTTTPTALTHTPFLIKQHSHPLLLPSQSSLDLPSTTGGSHHSLHRQLSYPTTSSDTQNLMLHPLGDISLTGAAQSIITTSSSSITSTAHFIERSDSFVKMEEEDQTMRHHQHTSVVAHQQAQVQITPSIVVVSDPVPMESEQSPSISGSAPSISNTRALSSADAIQPSIRIKGGEELQRSISLPTVTITYSYYFVINNKFSYFSPLVNCQSKVVRSIAPSFGLDLRWAAISAGTRSMTMAVFCDAKPSTIVRSARPIFVSCRASRNTTSARTTSPATLLPAQRHRR